MPAHLRDLPRCQACGSPATKALVNGVNAINGYFCRLHAGSALKDFQHRYETPRTTS